MRLPARIDSVCVKFVSKKNCIYIDQWLGFSLMRIGLGLKKQFFQRDCPVTKNLAVNLSHTQNEICLLTTETIYGNINNDMLLWTILFDYPQRKADLKNGKPFYWTAI